MDNTYNFKNLTIFYKYNKYYCTNKYVCANSKK